MGCDALVEKLKNSKNKQITFYYLGRRYEGEILAVDDIFLELHDIIGDYKKWFKIESIESLQFKGEF